MPASDIQVRCISFQMLQLIAKCVSKEGILRIYYANNNHLKLPWKCQICFALRTGNLKKKPGFTSIRRHWK